MRPHSKAGDPMAQSRSPAEVFLALVNGVAEGRWEELPSLYAEQTDVVHPFDPQRPAALRTREELREHFAPTGTDPTLLRRAANITIHQTTDPEVIIAEFEYQGAVAGAWHLRAPGPQRRDHQLARLFRPSHRSPGARPARRTDRGCSLAA